MHSGGFWFTNGGLNGVLKLSLYKSINCAILPDVRGVQSFPLCIYDSYECIFFYFYYTKSCTCKRFSVSCCLTEQIHANEL